MFGGKVIVVPRLQRVMLGKSLILQLYEESERYTWAQSSIVIYLHRSEVRRCESAKSVRVGALCRGTALPLTPQLGNSCGVKSYTNTLQSLWIEAIQQND